MKPKAKMKPLHWENLGGRQIQGTVWAEIGFGSYELPLDYTDFEANFREPDKKKAAQEEKKKPEAVRMEISLLNPKRVQAINIALGRLRVSATELRQALMRMDEDILNYETIGLLARVAPETEEIEKVKEFLDSSGDITLLDKPSKFILTLCGVPGVDKRIILFQFKQEADSLFASLQAKIDAVNLAKDQVMQSTYLKTILNAILCFGNYMNSGGRKGGAYGFKLSSLGRLKGSKSTDGKSNLLEYVMLCLEKKAPDAAALFVSSLASVKDATRVESASVAADIAGIKTKLALLQGQLTVKEKEKSKEEDKFVSVMRPFYNVMSQKFQRLESSYGLLLEECKRLYVCYAEEPDSKWEEFFQLFVQFATLWQEAADDLAAKREAQATQQKKDAAKAAKEAAKIAAEKKGPPPAPAAGGAKKGEEKSPERSPSSRFKAGHRNLGSSQANVHAASANGVSGGGNAHATPAATAAAAKSTTTTATTAGSAAAAAAAEEKKSPEAKPRVVGDRTMRAKRAVIPGLTPKPVEMQQAVSAQAELLKAQFEEKGARLSMSRSSGASVKPVENPILNNILNSLDAD